MLVAVADDAAPAADVDPVMAAFLGFLARGIDLEGGKRRGGALARIEELAVRRDVQIRRPGLAVEAGRQGADALLLLELPLLGIVVEDDDRAVELVEEIDELAVRVEHEVARTGLVLDLRRGRVV